MFYCVHKKKAARNIQGCTDIYKVSSSAYHLDKPNIANVHNLYYVSQIFAENLFFK